jgi:putative flippase GtrA
MKRLIDVRRLQLMLLLKNKFVRFLGTGALSTSLSYCLYLFFLGFVSYKFAYTISFVAGIVISYFLNSRMVFGSALRVDRFFKAIAIYLSIYLFNLFFIELLVIFLLVPVQFAPLLAVTVLLPFNYSLNRRLMEVSYE